METGNDYTRHIYEVQKELKSYVVYTLKDVQNGVNQLTEVIRIENYRGYSMGSGFNQLLRLRNSSSWKHGKLVTGLKFTKTDNVFFGDRLHNGKKNLLLFKFEDNRQRLIIDYFKGVYPGNEETIQKLIKVNYTA